jgi:hypothetical protein
MIKQMLIPIISKMLEKNKGHILKFAEQMKEKNEIMIFVINPKLDLITQQKINLETNQIVQENKKSISELPDFILEKIKNIDIE